MNLNVILGITIDTNEIIKAFKDNREGEEIIIVDYESNGEINFFENIRIYSPLDAKEIVKSYEVVKLYKSINIYPEIRT